MAKKKEQLSFQIECKSEPQWQILCKREGLIVVDVYSGWAGPCISISNFLRRIKGEINDNKLTFATVCADKIDDLRTFRDQSEPIWLFLAGSGKPVRLIRGCHVPNLAKAIKDEFDHEILCINGKARRKQISIDGDNKKKKLEAASSATGKKLQAPSSATGKKLQAPSSATGKKVQATSPAPGKKGQATSPAPGKKVQATSPAPGKKGQAASPAPGKKGQAASPAPGKKGQAASPAPGKKGQATSPAPGKKLQAASSTTQKNKDSGMSKAKGGSSKKPG